MKQLTIFSALIAPLVILPVQAQQDSTTPQLLPAQAMLCTLDFMEKAKFPDVAQFSEYPTYNANLSDGLQRHMPASDRPWVFQARTQGGEYVACVFNRSGGQIFRFVTSINMSALIDQK